MQRAIGTDVSFYQADDSNPISVRYINFDVMAEGMNFTIIRAGQRTYSDRDFAHNWKAAYYAGLPRGSYWFYDSRADPRKQAELYVSIVGNDLGELPMFADFEDTYKGAYSGWRHWYDFLDRLQNLVPGKEIGIYTGYYYWKENTVSLGIAKESLVWFAQFPLWIAQYKVQKPLIPSPWADWTFWQFTAEGDGIRHGAHSKELDVNYFNGDVLQFRQRFGLGEEIPAPQSSKTLIVSINGNQVEYKEKNDNDL